MVRGVTNGAGNALPVTARTMYGGAVLRRVAHQDPSVSFRPSTKIPARIRTGVLRRLAPAVDAVMGEQRGSITAMTHRGRAIPGDAARRPRSLAGYPITGARCAAQKQRAQCFGRNAGGKGGHGLDFETPRTARQHDRAGQACS